MPLNQTNKAISPFKFIKQATRPFSFNLFWIVVVDLFDAFMWVFRSYMLKVLIATYRENPSKEIFNILKDKLIMLIALEVLHQAAWRCHTYLIERNMMPKLKQHIIEYAASKVVGKSYHFFQNSYAGKLTYHIMTLSSQIPQVIFLVMERFLSQLFLILIALVMLLQLHWLYALMMISFITSFLFIVAIFNKPILQYSKKVAQDRSKISAQVTDMLTNILPVKLFSSVKGESKKVNSVAQAALKSDQKLHTIYFWYWSILSLTIIVFEGLCFTVLLHHLQEGYIGIEDFGFVIMLNNTILLWLWWNARLGADLNESLGEIKKALDYVYENDTVVDLPNAPKLEVKAGEIAFNNITFGYKEDKGPIFKDFSLTIKAKEKVGIVGYSGGGKSSLINILLRLFDIEKGSITIDGTPIHKVTKDSLREHIAVIPQTTALFHRSLMDNIRYGKEGATEEEVYRAAKKAHAHDFISTLPEGYQTLVGEGGVKISGGQRQRIAIARAILKDAPILVLDEATSALDSFTERSIQSSLERLIENKTVLIVAHRLSTLERVDRILVFEKGQLIEEGSQDELLAKKGHYKKLWDTQTNGFIGG